MFRQTQNDDNIFNQEKFPEPDARDKQLDETANILSTCWLLLEIFFSLILNMDLCFNLMLCILQEFHHRFNIQIFFLQYFGHTVRFNEGKKKRKIKLS